MAVDRLAARRAAQGYSNTNSNPTLASGNGGYESRPHAQQGYEMAEVNAARPGDMSEFHEEISSIKKRIKEFSGIVQDIGDLHSRDLHSQSMGDRNSTGHNPELANLIAKTKKLSAELKGQIANLQTKGSSPGETRIRKQQSEYVATKFAEALQNYQRVEKEYREKYKDKIARQILIVKPEATQEEISAAVNGDGQIFTQALLNNRFDQSRGAYQEVQSRHEELRRIEETITQLAELMNDMAILVNQQQETIEAIETQAANVQHDTEAGLKHTTDATKSARAARKKRWICFFLFLLLLVIIGAVIGGYYASQNKK